MSRRDNFLLLEDMKESTQKILQYVNNMDSEAFNNDEKTKDAVIRNFEIIGEAANRLDEEFRANNAQIAWTRLRGFRNRIVHEYFGIDYEIVWAIIVDDLGELLFQIDEILNSKKK